jgi:hypothetical protein
MRARALTVVALATLAGCGGGGNGGGGGPGGPDANQVLACVQDHGLRGVASGADTQLGTSAGLRINAPSGTQIQVDFFDDPDAAQTYSEAEGTFLGGAGGQGTSEVVDESVVVSANSGDAADQVAIVKGCIS